MTGRGMKNKRTLRQPKKGDLGYEDFFKSIKQLVSYLAALQAEAAVTYGPIVRGIINSRCKDPLEIQRTLDGLLDSCGNPAVLKLFKELCRYYYYLDPAATSVYIGFYLEQWEPERYEKIIREQKKKKARKM